MTDECPEGQDDRHRDALDHADHQHPEESRERQRGVTLFMRTSAAKPFTSSSPAAATMTTAAIAADGR